MRYAAKRSVAKVTRPGESSPTVQGAEKVLGPKLNLNLLDFKWL